MILIDKTEVTEGTIKYRYDRYNDNGRVYIKKFKWCGKCSGWRIEKEYYE